ncbi:wax ester/triacylglycerol synthase family O-acyltransferase [Streptomyces sp. NPDC049952]|uniref:Diacylglycerol O-acyltransferase n=1 Tax=Streptomyces pratensis (strain ATCC 33331 / IAF-45CD) TaxID=591167 RepID=A0A8D4BEY9_STRFA|nr:MULTISPECIES: wax ester/triacylglycerol synthase family O-acyltransferase [unclassified Streptomyces]MDF6066305.1 wax ester/triacylglycerol synthase family O-acyltransferase [Streptomyces sp. JH010]MEE1777592.1 wax ester/triacylglycerol synthase family O-acyltransferase [Streptomyces sp. JV181]MYT49315.1 wax ester/triacylglycerol synthase family O-acyltransferase [Streptomyces sp. SID7815]MYT55634.1 wax ester/triacylglycerol synthase family O-acyltransferase [Streptomyces sp. SID7834]
MSTELLAPLDLAFWHLESDAHPMHLGALAVFDPAPGASAPQLLDLLGARAAAIPRLRMRVRDVLLPVGGAAWFTDKDFEVQRHVTRVVLPEGDFLTEAGRLAGELMEQPLGRGLPPWRMYLLDSPGDGPFAVLVKLHHALADGMRAVAIGAGIFDQIASAGAGRGAVNRRTPVPPRSWLPGPYEVAGMARERLGEVGRALGVGASVVRASRLDLRATTALAARSSGTRRLATAELDAATVQRIRRTEGGTANDVLLAVVAGALRRWMLERGGPLPGADPRALVPVSRRRPGGAATGNKLSAYLLGLPVGEPDPRERLRLVRTGMNRNKAAGPLRGAGAVAVLADQLPALAHRFGAPLAGNAARMLFDILVTSVPLPRSALSLGGCPLRAVYPMAPLARGQALAIALSTYGGRVQVGLVADGKALPDLDRLATALREELRDLHALVPTVPAPA